MSKLNKGNFPAYFLVLTLFVGAFVFQYLGLIVWFALFMLSKEGFKSNIFLYSPIILFVLALISFFYNYVITQHADGYSIFFWIFSYFPPFALSWLVIAYRKQINFYDLYRFYKKLVYFECVLLIFSAIYYGKFVVGDKATGTVGDANWVAFHLCVVIIYESIRIVINWSRLTTKNKISSFIELGFFMIVFLIPESTANLGFVFIVLGTLFGFEFVLKKLNFLAFVGSLMLLFSLYFVIKDTYVFKRISDTVTLISEIGDDDENLYLSKIHIYQKLFSGEIYKETSYWAGDGPSNFTSRSSVMRMPDERWNKISIPLPYHKSRLYDNYISSITNQWIKSKESYGNFASPQTQLVSVAVELGIPGVLFFIFYFYLILRKKRFVHLTGEYLHLGIFVKYFSLYFILSLFHLNFWEYPIVSFTYILFVFSILFISQPQNPKNKELSTVAGPQAIN